MPGLTKMNVKFLVALTTLLCSAATMGAQEKTTKSIPPATAKAVPATQTKTKLKSKAKPKPKAKKKAVAKSKTPSKAPVVPAADQDSEADRAAIAAARDMYKKDLAERIGKASVSKMYTERPQALLRSVVVLEFAVDAEGEIVKCVVRRSNRDRVTEEAAMASLRESAPLPKPPAILVRHGPVEMHETWLFNNDGRFQIRSTAQKQIDR